MVKVKKNKKVDNFIPKQNHGNIKKKKELKKLSKDQGDDNINAVGNISKEKNLKKIDLHEKTSKINKKKKNKKNAQNKFKKIQDDQVSSTTQNVDKIQISNECVKSEVGHDNKKKGVGLGELWMNYKPRSTLLIKAQADWQSQLMDEDPTVLPTAFETKSKLKELARRILENDIENYMKVEENGPKKSDVQFRKTVFSYGTSRDKIAAHVLRCMEAPVHSLRNLNILVKNISPKSQDWMEASDSVRELLQTSLLSEGFVAREFENHSFNCLLPLLVVSREQAEQQLGLWYYEDQLKKAYRTLILQLKSVCSDSIEKNKSRGIRSLLILITNHPQQEAETILEVLVNKLGDPDRKVATNTMSGLKILLRKRPKLQGHVVTLVEILLYRPNMKEKAKYYCLCFLKDLLFSKEDSKLAEKLIKLYFGFFKACTKQGEVDTRLMSVLLAGIKRAIPYACNQGQERNEQLTTLYKICHIVTFNVATQALQLIYQVIGGGDNVNDRFYRLLYRQLQDQAFGVSSGTTAFLNLVFKVLVKDDSLQRIRAFIRRLFQSCQYQTSNLICGILYLISQVVEEKPQLGSVREAMLKAVLQESQTIEAQSQYDPYHRNPLYCGADYSSPWELQQLKDHFHPSVGLFASNLLSGQNIVYTGNPIQDFTSMRFLDRFAYKNPKKLSEQKDSAGGDVLGRRSQYAPHGVRGLQVNSAQFSNLEENQIPEDDLFFHRYFKKYKIEKLDDTEETSSNEDDDFDDYLKRMGGLGSDDEDADENLDFAASTKEIDGMESDGSNEDDMEDLPEDGDDDDDDNDDDNDDDISGGKDELDADDLGLHGGGDDDEPEFDGDVDSDPDKWQTLGELSSDDEELTMPKSKKQKKDKTMKKDSNKEKKNKGMAKKEKKDDFENVDSSGESDMEFDEEAVAFSDDDFGRAADKKGKQNKKANRKILKSQRKKNEGTMGIFADAEEFSHLLEENAEKGSTSITSQAISNWKKADAKQLKYEIKRDEEIRGVNWRRKKGKQGGYRGGGRGRGRGRKVSFRGGRR